MLPGLLLKNKNDARVEIRYSYISQNIRKLRMHILIDEIIGNLLTMTSPSSESSTPIRIEVYRFKFLGCDIWVTGVIINLIVKILHFPH
jgi:hypothetical protein